MALDNEQLVRQAYKVAEEMDLAGWIAAFTEDGTFTDESIGVTWQGPSELPEQVENYHRAFPDMHRELHQLYVSGNIVVVQLALQGTHLGPLHLPAGTLRPTGKRMDAPCCDVFELADMRAERHRLAHDAVRCTHGDGSALRRVVVRIGSSGSGMAQRHAVAHFSRLTWLDSSQRQQRHALRGGHTGQAGDVHPLVTAIAPKGVQMCATARLPQPHRPIKAAAGQQPPVRA